MNEFTSLTFENLDGSPVYINPLIPGDVAQHLSDALLAVARHMADDPLQLDITLGAADRGSLRLVFKIALDALGKSPAERIGTCANAATLLTALYGGFTYIGQEMGYFQPQAPAQAVARPEHVPLDATKDRDIQNVVEGFARLVVHAGGDTVFIDMPDQPRCLIVDAGSNPKYIGWNAFAGIPAYDQGAVAGEIEVIGLPVTAIIDGAQRTLQTAHLTVTLRAKPLADGSTVDAKTSKYDVFLDWQSEAPLPSVGGKATVTKANLVDIKSDQLNVITPIGAQHRSVVGLLTVKAVIVLVEK